MLSAWVSSYLPKNIPEVKLAMACNAFILPCDIQGVLSFLWLSICSSIHSPIYSSVNPSIHDPFTHPVIHRSVHPSVLLSICSSILKFIHPSMLKSIYSFIHPFILSLFSISFAGHHKQIPADFEQEAGYTLDRSPIK